MSNKTLYIGGALVIVALFVGGALWNQLRPGQFDAFAECLGDRGVIFYGAFWCPHCQEQKALFGNSAKHLPYVECSTPNGQGQLQICIDEGVNSYPTWEFADGERVTGVLPLDVLSERTGCPLSG